MIGYIEGKLLKKETDRVLLLVHGIGYEILVSAMVMQKLDAFSPGETVSLFIYHHQTERNPKPVLIGFSEEMEKSFFQQFITVEDIGPLKALRAMEVPVTRIAQDIENEDETSLSSLKGIGRRLAKKIIAGLKGRMEPYLEGMTMLTKDGSISGEVIDQVLDVLVARLGYRSQEARAMIKKTLSANPSIQNAEHLLDEILRGTNQ